MQLEDYFLFLSPDDIRLKGTRVGTETILYDYIYRSRTPEEIANIYPSLSLEQVYATILYYLHNKKLVNQYIADWLEHGEQMWAEQQRNPSPVRLRLQQIKESKVTIAHESQVSV